MRKHTKKLLGAFAMVFLVSSLQAQYKGIVIDAADKSPLPGAVVQADGTGSTALTDMDGNWSLDVPKGTEITVSFVGYLNKSIILGDQKDLRIALSYDQASSTLDEVVVVGYVPRRKAT